MGDKTICGQNIYLPVSTLTLQIEDKVNFMMATRKLQQLTVCCSKWKMGTMVDIPSREKFGLQSTSLECKADERL